MSVSGGLGWPDPMGRAPSQEDGHGKKEGDTSVSQNGCRRKTGPDRFAEETDRHESDKNGGGDE